MNNHPQENSSIDTLAKQLIDHLASGESMDPDLKKQLLKILSTAQSRATESPSKIEVDISESREKLGQMDKRGVVREAMDWYVNKGEGRSCNYFRDLKINSKDKESALFVIELIQEAVEKEDLAKLYKMLQFLSDFERDVGGGVDALYIGHSDADLWKKMEELNKSFLTRLLEILGAENELDDKDLFAWISLVKRNVVLFHEDYIKIADLQDKYNMCSRGLKGNNRIMETQLKHQTGGVKNMLLERIREGLKTLSPAQKK